jgi:hypothetical protein
MAIHRQKLQLALYTSLVVLIFVGVMYRFSWINWNQDTNLHPDEYGLTNTLTQLSFPRSLTEYFNTRISPISPYPKYDLMGQALMDGPDNRMRWGQWPIILIRGLAEITGNTGYNELRIMGRYISALMDTLTLLLTYWIGRRLYNHWVGLLGAALSSLAVMQIQQSHFMTVDNFAVVFAVLTMFTAVRIAQQPPTIRRQNTNQSAFDRYQIHWQAVGWYLLFGVSLGMTLASKINLLPLAGMLLVAAFISIADLKLRYREDLQTIFLSACLFMLLAGITTLITFRFTQPMSFRATTGDTAFWTLQLNPDWVESMKVAQQESNGIGGGPPSEQWADRPIIIFPLMNMIVWGMGIPLGIAGWAGFGWAAWRSFKGHSSWRAHLLPLLWTGGYFLFMATRWVKSIRYFLPIYPFLCLLAAWGLVELITRLQRSHTSDLPEQERKWPRAAITGLLTLLVVGGTLVWSTAFVNAVYRQPHTRIQTTEWIFANIPGPFHLQLETSGKQSTIPVGAPDGLQVAQGVPFVQAFQAVETGQLVSITLPHVQAISNTSINLVIIISSDNAGTDVLDQSRVVIQPTLEERGSEVQGVFQGTKLIAGETYYLIASTATEGSVQVYRNTIANEDWDEGLPVRFAGYDPFGQFYRGVTMPVRWTDDENKRQSYLDYLETVDYIILPSQRSIWSICRLPKMYPLTIEYYRALFDGRLGFEQVALFQAPWKIGPLQISDAGGTIAWDEPPSLPRFNFNRFAAEEAFTVYDHPPVWVFHKRTDFSIDHARALLSDIDISQAVFQSPRHIQVSPIQP